MMNTPLQYCKKEDKKKEKKTVLDINDHQFNPRHWFWSNFEYQRVQCGSGAKATHTCCNNTSVELVNVTQLHGVWVHSSSLLPPIAGDPPPPSLTSSTNRYPRCPWRHWLNMTVQMLQPEEEVEPPMCVVCVSVCMRALIHICLFYVCTWRVCVHKWVHWRRDKKRGE